MPILPNIPPTHPLTFPASSTGTKRKKPDENTPLTFLHTSGPPQKRVRRIAQPLTPQIIQDAQHSWLAKQDADRDIRRAVEEAKAADNEVQKRAESTARISEVLGAVKKAGYGSLFEFMDELLTTRDQQQSSQVSRMLVAHGAELLDSIRARQPRVTNDWILLCSGEMIAAEGKWLADYLRPAQGQKVSHILENFSLERILRNAEAIAPTFCNVLRHFARGHTEQNAETKGQKDKDLAS
jgi:hypothetical protein